MGQLNGTKYCNEWIEGEQYMCMNYGDACVYGIVGDSLDVALVSDDALVEVASREGPSTFATVTCTGRKRVYHVDGDGRVLAATVVSPPLGTFDVKPLLR